MPVLSAAKLFQRLEGGQVDPLYLLFGDEPYLIEAYAAVCIERILGTAPRDFNYDAFTATGDTLSEALGIARTLPMLATHRVVVLHGLQQLRKDDLHSLDNYASDPVESTALICSSTETDARKFPATLWQRALAVECKRLEGEALRAWVRQEVTAYGGTIDHDAVYALLQEQQHDLQTIKREIEKLCTYAGDAGHIGLADVQEVCHASYLHSIFQLSDALGARHVVQAFAIVDGLLQQGEPPLVIFSMIVRHLRLLWSMQHLSRQQTQMADIARTLHLPIRVCRQLAMQSRQMSPDHLQRLYSAAVEADVAFKSTPKPPKAILESLILDVCRETRTPLRPER